VTETSNFPVSGMGVASGGQRTLPWARPRHEWLLLVLVAFAALSSVYVVSTQDVTRLCLTRAVLHGQLSIQPCAGHTIDQASYAGHRYTDKAPGLSFLALPVAWATGVPSAPNWPRRGSPDLWIVRLATCGVALMASAFLIGRISEGIAPGLGGAALVAAALGTYAAPLAATTFGHVLAGGLAFGGFVSAWSRRYLLAGFLAATAVGTDYLCALIGVVLAVYVLRAGLPRFLRFAVGAAPPFILLGAYDSIAFGSPFHLSYRYVANNYASNQASGLFGIDAPSGHGVEQVFLGSRGILIASPVIVVAAGGLILLARRHRPEAIACGAVLALLLLANCGYFLPYGGISPGPRFLVPALPFVALGLAPAFARWFRVTAILSAASIVAMTALTLTWANTRELAYRQTIWGEIARVFTQRGHSRIVHLLLTKNAIDWIGLDKVEAAGLVCFCAAAAYALSLYHATRASESPRRRRKAPLPGPSSVAG
jgi:hypothetical protein